LRRRQNSTAANVSRLKQLAS